MSKPNPFTLKKENNKSINIMDQLINKAQGSSDPSKITFVPVQDSENIDANAPAQ